MILHPAPDHCSKITREKELTEEQKFSSLLQNKHIYGYINNILKIYERKCNSYPLFKQM